MTKTENQPRPHAGQSQEMLGGLVIHIGSQKTGSTALQNFLSANESALASKGIRFLTHGRRNISHNSLFRPLHGSDARNIWTSVAEEVTANQGELSIMSSENFFTPSIAISIAQHMPEPLRKITRVIVYLRRQDAYLEAMYKQKTKNGRDHITPKDFVRNYGDDIAGYQTILAAFAKTLGKENIILRRFERSSMKGGDIVADFLDNFGLILADNAFVQPAHEANQTLSRAVTEQMGALARHSSLNVRELAREIMRDPDGPPRRSGDVFTKEQRLQIMDHFTDENAEVVRQHLTDTNAPLFDMQDLSQNAPDPYPDPHEEIALYAQAQEQIAAAIGRIIQRDRNKLFRG